MVHKCTDEVIEGVTGSSTEDKGSDRGNNSNDNDSVAWQQQQQEHQQQYLEYIDIIVEYGQN